MSLASGFASREAIEISTPGSGRKRVEPADVVLMRVRERDPHDQEAELLGRREDRLRGTVAAHRGVDEREPVVLVEQEGVDDPAVAGDAREAHALLEQRDALDVRRLREHVDGAHAAQRPARLDELRRVGRERRRVARDVDDALRRRPR